MILLDQRQQCAARARERRWPAVKTMESPSEIDNTAGRGSVTTALLCDRVRVGVAFTGNRRARFVSFFIAGD